MEKILKVIKPFFVMEEGDTFQYSEERGMYVSTFSMEDNESNDKLTEITSSYNSEYSISEGYARTLIEKGFLVEVSDSNKTEKAPFVNIFDEIERLRTLYASQLNDIDSNMEDFPECLKTEKRAVLSNFIKLLNYLNSLKK